MRLPETNRSVSIVVESEITCLLRTHWLWFLNDLHLQYLISAAVWSTETVPNPLTALWDTKIVAKDMPVSRTVVIFQQGKEETYCFIVNYSTRIEEQLSVPMITGSLLPVRVSVWVEYSAPFNVLGGVKHIGT